MTAATEAEPTAEAAPEAPQAFTPPRKGDIFKAMSAVMAEVGAVGKNHTNPEQHYTFRSIDDAYNAVQPALVKAGVFCIPRVIRCDREPVESARGGKGTRFILETDYEWCAGDGSSVTCRMVGEAVDYSDKGANKAQTAGYKYALLQVFCIRLTDKPQDRDADFGDPRPASGESDSEGKPQAAGHPCPKCGKPLVHRTRKDGKGEGFMGCSGYPECKHTEKVPKDGAKGQAADAGKKDAKELAKKKKALGGAFLEAADGDEEAARAAFCFAATTALAKAITPEGAKETWDSLTLKEIALIDKERQAIEDTVPFDQGAAAEQRLGPVSCDGDSEADFANSVDAADETPPF